MPTSGEQPCLKRAQHPSHTLLTSKFCNHTRDEFVKSTYQEGHHNYEQGLAQSTGTRSLHERELEVRGGRAIMIPHSNIRSESHIEGRRRFKKTLDGTLQTS